MGGSFGKTGKSYYTNTAPKYTGGGGDASYIGVPDDWMQRQAAAGQVKHGPLDPKQFTPVPGGNFDWVRTPYETGAETSLVNRSPAEIREFQSWARRVGLIGPNTRITDGMVDQPTISAFRELLGFANVNGLDISEAQAKFTSSVTATEEEKRIPRVFDPPEQRKANVKDIKAVIRATALEIMGQEPNEQQINRVLVQFREGEEAQYQGTLAAAKENFELERYYNEERGAPKPTANTIIEAPGVDSLATEEFLKSDAALKWSLAQAAMGAMRIFRGG